MERATLRIRGRGRGSGRAELVGREAGLGHRIGESPGEAGREEAKGECPTQEAVGKTTGEPSWRRPARLG